MDDDANRLHGKFVFKTLFYPYFKRLLWKKPVEIYDAFKTVVTAFEEKGSFCTVKSNDVIECKHYIRFEINNDETKADDHVNVLEENPEYLKYLNNKHKLLFDFLKKNEYLEPREKVKMIDESKICKVKELRPVDNNENQPQKKSRANVNS